MPRTPTDYSKTVIYKIVCNDLTKKEVYVGNTTDFTVRKYNHKYNCNTPSSREYDKLIYKYIRENGGWDKFSMLEIEKYPCKDGNEARTRERYWYEQLNAKLNQICPITSKQEKKEYMIQYREENKEKLKAQRKQYCDNHKEKVKKYYEANKEHYKRYREENKEKISEKRNIKVECECGCITSKSNLAYHKKSKQHQSLIKNLTPII